MLTPKQYQLLLYIDNHLKRTGFSPSFDEMKEALALRSKSGIHRLISALEERGFLKRHHHKARALEILHLPHVEKKTLPSEKTDADDARPANILRGVFSESVHAINTQRSTPVPLLGRIAAGLPVEALETPSDVIDVPSASLPSGTYYALTVSGDSMTGAGIHDGDTVVIRESQSAENGQIVVAVIDDFEATLKIFRRSGRSIALEPANAAYETQIFPADRVTIKGQLVALFRQY